MQKSTSAIYSAVRIIGKGNTKIKFLYEKYFVNAQEAIQLIEDDLVEALVADSK